jgi:hypothetical protein
VETREFEKNYNQELVVFKKCRFQAKCQSEQKVMAGHSFGIRVAALGGIVVALFAIVAVFLRRHQSNQKRA